MAPKKILIIVGDFVEDLEAYFPYQVLLLVGHHVDVVSPDKKAGDTVKTAVHDFEGDQTYTEKRGHNLRLTADFASVNAETYDGLIIPGGRAPEFLRLNEKVLEIVRHFAEKKKPVASICHGPQVLAAAGVLHGTHVTAYPALKPEIVLSGAKWDDHIKIAEALTDSSKFPLVTAPAWPAHPEWMRKFLELLGSKIEA